MRAMKMTKSISIVKIASGAAAWRCFAGIDDACGDSRHHRYRTFNLTAQTAFLNQPDGAAVYSWGYGCNGAPTGFAPAAITNATCPIDASSRSHADRHGRTDGHRHI